MSSKQISIFLTLIVRAVSLSSKAWMTLYRVSLSHPVPASHQANHQHLVECTGSQILYALEPISCEPRKDLFQNEVRVLHLFDKLNCLTDGKKPQGRHQKKKNCRFGENCTIGGEGVRKIIEFSSFTNDEKHRRGGVSEFHFITSQNPIMINLEGEIANIYLSTLNICFNKLSFILF